MRRVWLLVVVIALVAAGCGHPPSRVVLEPNERVIGRARDGKRVRLLTTSGRLVTVQLSDLSTASETVVGLERDEAPWGLAVSSDGRWWTLAGTSHAAEIGERGRVASRLALEGSYVGLFSVGDTILIQPATPAPGEPVLQGLNLETLGRWNTGSLRSSSFDTRAETLAFNLVACGSGVCHRASVLVQPWSPYRPSCIDGKGTAAGAVRNRASCRCRARIGATRDARTDHRRAHRPHRSIVGPLAAVDTDRW